MLRLRFLSVMLISAFLLGSCNTKPKTNGGVPLNPSSTPDPIGLAPSQNPGSQPQAPENTADSIGIAPGEGLVTPSGVPLVERYPRPKGQVNILIFGSDFRPDAGYRTDVMLLLSLNPLKNTASLISFPRDLYVNIPGWQMQRLNTAQQHGGFALTQKTFELNFGVHPDHYIMTNFEGFRAIITTLGGIDVVASKPLSDKCDLPKTAVLKEVDGFCNVSPGTVHLDADSALWYARARYSTDDFDRTRRAQEVIQAIFKKIVSLEGLTKVPQIYDQMKNYVETDMRLDDMVALAPLAVKLKDLNGVQLYRIDRNYVNGWITPNGADVQIPHTEEIFNQIIAKACYDQ